MNRSDITKKEYWDGRYKNNETGWDIKQVSPPLKDYIDTLTDNKLEILIPGCGNAYEAEYLLNKGFNNVTLIDIAPTLVNTLKEKFTGKPIQVLNEDFFEHSGKYDLILEQTFFCAIDPSLRKRYVDTCFNLLKDEGKIAGLLFNIVFEKQGPPYGGTKLEYEALFKAKFKLNKFSKCLISIAPRKDNELFIELEKK
jgi:SAM-dependent methyltransferase